MTVILDCNIWVTLAINGEFDFIADLFDNEITIVSCDELKREIENVLSRPKLKRYVSDEQSFKMIALHDLSTTFSSLGNFYLLQKIHWMITYSPSP